MSKNFSHLAEGKLIKIADYIEHKDHHSTFDVEYADGILNINVFKTKQVYVINKHSASQKIWFSSPISGANYFSYDESNQKWLDDKGKELEEFLIKELQNNFGF